MYIVLKNMSKPKRKHRTSIFPVENQRKSVYSSTFLAVIFILCIFVIYLNEVTEITYENLQTKPIKPTKPGKLIDSSESIVNRTTVRRRLPHQKQKKGLLFDMQE